MKICYIGDVYTVHTRRWVRYFAARGHEVFLFSTVPMMEGNDDIGQAELHILKGCSRRFNVVSNAFGLMLGAIQVRNFLKKIKPDILHAFYITDNGLIGIMSGFHPLVLSAWGSDVLIDPKRFFLLKALVKYALKKADMITADGENTIEEMQKMGVDPRRTHIIYHGVDTQQFKPASKNEALEKELGLSESPVIISMRSLNPVYNVETVVKSVPLVLKQFPEAQFLIGGDGMQRDYLKDMARSLGVLEHTRFLGNLPHHKLPEYLVLADVYVSTSLSDSFSLSLAEAMSCGLAPVVTDSGDSRKWIENGKNGFIIPVKNAKILAEKTIYLLQNKELRRNMGEINRQMVEQRANYEKEMDKVEKLYQELVKRS
jgi:glycosyltransferase involved in cell wall biosynthesis